MSGQRVKGRRSRSLATARRAAIDALAASSWGVRALGLPGNVSAYGVGDTLEWALEDLSEGVQAALGDGPRPAA